MFDWAKMGAWHLVLPPNRPDANNVQHVSACLAGRQSRRPLRGAILGSTPEYRSVLRRHCAEVHILDKSTDFKAISDSISGTHPNENFISGDWLETLSSCRGRFDIICSHFTHGNISFAQRPRFFELISDALAADGVFFDTVFDPQTGLYSLPQIQRRFSDQPINLQVANDFNSIALFQSEKMVELGCVDTTAIYDWLEPILEDNHLWQLARYTKAVTPPGLRWDYALGRGPMTFGYDHAFEVRSQIFDDRSSSFASNSYLLISGKPADARA